MGGETLLLNSGVGEGGEGEAECPKESPASAASLALGGVSGTKAPPPSSSLPSCIRTCLAAPPLAEPGVALPVAPLRLAFLGVLVCANFFSMEVVLGGEEVMRSWERHEDDLGRLRLSAD